MKAQNKDCIPVLSIAGSDCSGGAGIQADLKTFGAHNVFGMSIVLSVVAENTVRVISSFDVPTKVIDEQFVAVFEDIPPKATKIGMLGSCEIIECVAHNLAHYKPENLVIDPVMFAKNGFALMPENIRNVFREKILRFADVLTPNIPEAQELCGFEIASIEDMKHATKSLCDLGAKMVLLKGGHRQEDCSDVFFDGKDFFVLPSDRIETKNTHGTGCSLSSAIAALWARTDDLPQAVRLARRYIEEAINASDDLTVGSGHGPIHHFVRFESLYS